MNDDDYENIAARKAEFYRDTARESVANIGLIKHLRYLKKCHKIVLVTTAKKRNALAVLEHHGLYEYFDYIITAEDVKSSKPSPECYELALKLCDIKPLEALAFEDSQPGVEAAEKAGIPVIVVNDFSTL
ncbi:Phosphorylated carbohydrates phosphatase [compost metagenome]